MKRSILILAGALAACNPPVDETPGVFEEFPVARVQPAGCVFAAPDSDAPDSALFVSRLGDIDHLAYVLFKGETLKLVPRIAPDLTGEVIDVTYDVVDYLKWNVRVTAAQQANGKYVGTLALVDTNVVTPISGQCAS